MYPTVLITENRSSSFAVEILVFLLCAVEHESAFVLFSHFYMGNKMNLINTVTCGGFCMMNSFILHKEFFT